MAEEFRYEFGHPLGLLADAVVLPLHHQEFGLFLLVPSLEHVPGLLLLALVGEQALAVVVILNAGEHAAR